MVPNRKSKPINILVLQHQFFIDPGINIGADSNAVLWDSTDLASLQRQALDFVPTGRTLKGFTLLWTNTNSCFAIDSLVQDNNKVRLALRNASDNANTITLVRILAFWE
jgi:hypothetical protein